MITFLHCEVVKLFRQLATLDELLHLSCIFALHALSIRRVLSLEEESEKLEHCFLKRKGRVLQAVLAYFSETTGHNVSKGLLHE